MTMLTQILEKKCNGSSRTTIPMLIASKEDLIVDRKMTSFK